jgi:hypothetical protein
VGWVVREGVGTGGEMTQALYAHMNNKKKIKKKLKNFKNLNLFLYNLKEILALHPPVSI